MLFRARFKMQAREPSQYEMEEKSVLKQKSGRASNTACPLGTKSGWTATPAQYVLLQMCTKMIGRFHFSCALCVCMHTYVKLICILCYFADYFDKLRILRSSGLALFKISIMEPAY